MRDFSFGGPTSMRDFCHIGLEWAISGLWMSGPFQDFG